MHSKSISACIKVERSKESRVPFSNLGVIFLSQTGVIYPCPGPVQQSSLLVSVSISLSTATPPQINLPIVGESQGTWETPFQTSSQTANPLGLSSSIARLIFPPERCPVRWHGRVSSRARQSRKL